MSESIIVDETFLLPDFLPERLRDREAEYGKLSANIQNRVSTLIVGPLGVGKTALVRRVAQDIRQAEVRYVDCDLYQTEYAVLRELIPATRFIFARSSYELLKELQRRIRERPLAVCLDNFPRLKEVGIARKLAAIGVTIVVVGRIERELLAFNENLMTRIPSIIRMAPLPLADVVEVLRERAIHSMAVSSFSEELLTVIAERTEGNLAQALAMFRVAAVHAHVSSKAQVQPADLEDYWESLRRVPELNEDEATLLTIVKREKRLPASELYRMYRAEVQTPKAERTLRGYLQTLVAKGMVRAVGENSTRVYEIVE